jgi:hypothetical protein
LGSSSFHTPSANQDLAGVWTLQTSHLRRADLPPAYAPRECQIRAQSLLDRLLRREILE